MYIYTTCTNTFFLKRRPIVVKEQNFLNMHKVTHWSATKAIFISRFIQKLCA